ncbi:MAG: hypothetical protein Q9170_005572 [Blastenia crenularia]
MASNRMERAVHGIEAIIGYTFDDPYLVWEAVSAAGSVVSGGGRQFPNGNKRLAILGDTVLQLVLAEDWYSGRQPRAAFDRIRQHLASNGNLNSVGRSHGIDAHVNLAGGQSVISPATMAATVEAVIGAVYLDSSSTHAVRDILRPLGLTSSSLG